MKANIDFLPLKVMERSFPNGLAAKVVPIATTVESPEHLKGNGKAGSSWKLPTLVSANCGDEKDSNRLRFHPGTALEIY